MSKRLLASRLVFWPLDSSESIHLSLTAKQGCVEALLLVRQFGSAGIAITRQRNALFLCCCPTWTAPNRAIPTAGLSLCRPTECKKPIREGWAKCKTYNKYSVAPRPGIEPGTCGLTDCPVDGEKSFACSGLIDRASNICSAGVQVSPGERRVN